MDLPAVRQMKSRIGTVSAMVENVTPKEEVHPVAPSTRPAESIGVVRHHGRLEEEDASSAFPVDASTRRDLLMV